MAQHRGPATIRSPRTKALDIGTEAAKFPPDQSQAWQQIIAPRPPQPPPAINASAPSTTPLPTDAQFPSRSIPPPYVVKGIIGP